jgi:hypothetical protein
MLRRAKQSNPTEKSLLSAKMKAGNHHSIRRKKGSDKRHEKTTVHHKKQNAMRRSERRARPNAKFVCSNNLNSTNALKDSNEQKVLGNLDEYTNLPDGVITTTPDRLRIFLDEHDRIMAGKRGWRSLLTFTLTLLLTLVTTEFKDRFFIPGSTWHGIFMIAFIASFLWLGWSLYIVITTPKDKTDMVGKMIKQSTHASNNQLRIVRWDKK